MKLRYFMMLIGLLPCAAHAVSRGEATERVGMRRVALATGSVASTTATVKPSTSTGPSVPSVSDTTTTPKEEDKGQDTSPATPAEPVDCRDAYRACMDEFCLLDETEGYRCACSDNINKSKSLIQEIQRIQSEADKMYTEDVERAQLGAKASLVFGQSEAAKKSTRASGLSFAEWLKGDSDDEAGLGADEEIGSNLYAMASKFCSVELESCPARAKMEELLYSRQITADCKAFESYLADQKSNAESNKRTAEAAVRAARLEMLNTTDKYNRGECLLAYRACIADKGGCGANFENCLDADLLGRRANACENVLDQCMASRTYVLTDWAAESQAILVDAAKYADKNARLTCMARIQYCLEDGCATETNSACLTDVNVAAGICPVINECEQMIPGIKTAVNDKLGYLRTQFCQNDIDKCLRDRCGENFTAPECLGKKTSDIVALCPQSMFPSCKNETQFDIIVSSILLQMDYKMLQGCLNYFSEQLGRVCGTDMSCLPTDTTVASLVEIPSDTAGFAKLRETVRNNSEAAVDTFFVQFEKDITVAACADSQKPSTTGGYRQSSLGQSVFNTAKMIAQISAENRAMRQLETKIAELSRQQDLESARKNCLETYRVETPEQGAKNYSYIRSVSFEPALRNCHVCRMQQVCEVGGESKSAAAMKGLAGGMSSGAALGTSVMAGWGTAIGGVVGALGGAFGNRAMSSGKQEFCQEIESCEDVNM